MTAEKPASGQENQPKAPEKAKTEAELQAEKTAAEQKIKDASVAERKDLLKDIFGKAIEGFGDILKNWEQFIEGFWNSDFKGFNSVGDSSQKPEVSAESVPEKTLSAEKALKAALAKNPEWKTYAAEAMTKFRVPENIVFAIIHLESGFKVSVKNKDSNATGLGQFIPSTWAEFQKNNPEFANSDPKDPRASIMATAWYCRRNADRLGIDLNAPDAAAKIYRAHHEGEAGYARMEAYLTGQRSSLNVPESYASAGYNTPSKYTSHIVSLGNNVQGVANNYKEILA